jgi:hypothetical protein
MSNNQVKDNNVIIELSEQTPDIEFLMAKITSLSLAVETLRNENSHLLQELVEKDALLEEVVAPEHVGVPEQVVSETQHSVCARDIAMKAEVKVMDFIFPECRRKPYCLRSYKHLLSFVANPTTDNTSSFAPIYWNELDDNVKLGIVDRIDFMKSNSMYLKTHIEDLKIDNVINNTVCGSVDELMNFLMSCNSEVKDDLVEALDECVKFLDFQLVLTSPSLILDEVSEVTAKDIAIKAELKAMDFVFPECRKKPYCLRSYRNLVSFVSHPTDEYTGPTAPAMWNTVDELVKQDIRSKIDDVASHCEYLKTHVKDLKNGGDLTIQVCPDIESIKELLRVNDKSELLESLEECLHFLEVKLFSNIIVRPRSAIVRTFGEEKPLLMVTDETSIASSSNIVTRNTVSFLRGFSRGF